MKKWISLFLVVVLVMSLATGCGSNGNPAESAKTTDTTETADGQDGAVAAKEVYTPYLGALLGLPYFIDHKIGLELGGQVYGHKTDVIGPTEYDMTALAGAIEQQITQDPTAL